MSRVIVLTSKDRDYCCRECRYEPDIAFAFYEPTVRNNAPFCPARYRITALEMGFLKSFSKVFHKKIFLNH